jgi:hypothetical protein
MQRGTAFIVFWGLLAILWRDRAQLKLTGQDYVFWVAIIDRRGASARYGGISISQSARA